MKLLLPKTLLKFLFIAMLFVGQVGFGQVTIIPKLFLSAKNTPSGDANWTFANATANNASTDYWKMVAASAGSVVTSPTMDFSVYTGITVTVVTSSFGTVGSNSDYLKLEYFNGTTWSQVVFGNSAVYGSAINLAGTSVNSKIRLTATNANGTAGARLTSVEIKGIASITPSLTATPSSLNALTYVYGAGPSNVKTFALTGANLNGTQNVTLVPGNNWEISIDQATWINYASSLVLANYNGTSKTIYVRLKAGFAVGNYNNASNDIVIIEGYSIPSGPVVTLSGSVTAKALTVTGLTGSNKVYDATTAATVSGTPVLNGVLAADAGNVSLSGTPAYAFANATVANGKAITVSGLTLTGSAASNYTVTQPGGLTADITPKTITASGVTAANKTYTRTNLATISGGTLTGVIASDVSNVSVSTAGSFASVNVGTGIVVTVSLTGTASGNYTLTQPGITADITPKALTIAGVTVTQKVYDGSTTAVLSGTAALSGVISPDVVSLITTGVTANFNTAAVGATKPVTATGYTLSGTSSGNYTVTQPTTLTATITAKPLTVNGLTANNKVQDGTTAATLSGTATLSGVVSGDEIDVTLSGTQTATFASALPATGIVVSVTGYSLTGTKASNYMLTALSLSANITALGAPIATAATTVLSNGFTANWNGVTGATGYDLEVSTSPTFGTSSVGTVTEGFESVTFPSTGWITTGWTRSTTAGDINSGNGAAIAGSNTGTLTTAAIANPSSMSFYLGRSNNTTVKTLTIEVSTTSQTTGFSIVDTFNHSNVPSASYDQYTVDLSGYSNAPVVYVRFNKSSTSTSPWRLDDIVINYGSSTPDFVAGYDPKVITGGATVSSVVSGLNPATTYHYRVRAINGSFTSVNSNVIDVTTLVAPVIWNGTAWSNGTGPTSSLDAIINGVYTTNGDTANAGAGFTAKSLTVSAGSFTINSGDTVMVVNQLTNNLTAAAFVVENNANLLQQGTTNTNTGNITVHRNSAAIKRLDYTLWSSPVTGQGLYAFSKYTLPNRFYKYDQTTNNYSNAVGFNLENLEYPSPLVVPNGVNGNDVANVPFGAATGYLIRTPYNHPTDAQVYNGTFTGAPHNGIVPVTTTSGLYYAVGNPYPSTISADTFISNNNIGNSASVPGDGLYFWRKTNNANQSTNPSASYATYTTAGGVVSGGDLSATPIKPNGVIQIGEGFIVKATSGSLNFNNGQRIANNDNQFLRNTTIERNRIWLNLSDSATKVNQMMVSYMTGATQDVDAAIDARYFNDSPTALNSFLNNEAFAIQGRSLPFDPSDVVPLAFKAANAGNYTIAIDQVDGLFTGTEQPIYLKDNLTNTIHNLSANAYTFASEVGTFNTRFEMVYQTQLANPTFTATGVVIYAQNNEFVVSSGNTSMRSIKVFDIRGRLIEEKTAVNANLTTIKGGLSNQVLLVQITSEDGVIVTKKVVR